MRWILVFLVLLNITYYGWASYVREEPSRSANITPPRQAEGVVSLALLSELPDHELGFRERAETSDKTGRDQPKEPICWLMGPFPEQITAKQFIARTAALDIKTEMKTVAVPQEPDYWVHIAPLPSRQAALDYLKKLQADRIDSYLITEGELANGISLGFFSSRERAEKVHRKRVDQGYEAIIKEVPRTRDEQWAMLTEQEYAKFSDELWRRLREDMDFLEKRQNPCSAIVSASQIE